MSDLMKHFNIDDFDEDVERFHWVSFKSHDGNGYETYMILAPSIVKATAIAKVIHEGKLIPDEDTIDLRDD